MLDENKEKN